MRGIILLFSAGLFACECAAQKGVPSVGAEVIASPGKFYSADNGFSLGAGICGQYERQFEYQWSVYGAADFLGFLSKNNFVKIKAATFEAGLKYFPAISGKHNIRTLHTLGIKGWFLNAAAATVLANLSLGDHGSAGTAELLEGRVETTKINPSLCIGGGYLFSPSYQIGFRVVLVGDFPHIWYAAGFRTLMNIF